jgi:hypothetical protein
MYLAQCSPIESVVGKHGFDVTTNCQELKDLEEASLKQWILDIDEHGLPLNYETIHKRAIYCYLIESLNLLVLTGSFDLLNNMTILHPNILASTIINV